MFVFFGQPGGADIKSQMNCGGNLIDILPARTPGVNRGYFQLILWYIEPSQLHVSSTPVRSGTVNIAATIINHQQAIVYAKITNISGSGPTGAGICRVCPIRLCSS